MSGLCVDYSARSINAPLVLHVEGDHGRLRLIVSHTGQDGMMEPQCSCRSLAGYSGSRASDGDSVSWLRHGKGRAHHSAKVQVEYVDKRCLRYQEFHPY